MLNRQGFFLVGFQLREGECQQSATRSDTVWDAPNLPVVVWDQKRPLGGLYQPELAVQSAGDLLHYFGPVRSLEHPFRDRQRNDFREISLYRMIASLIVHLETRSHLVSVTTEVWVSTQSFI